MLYQLSYASPYHPETVPETQIRADTLPPRTHYGTEIKVSTPLASGANRGGTQGRAYSLRQHRLVGRIYAFKDRVPTHGERIGSAPPAASGRGSPGRPALRPLRRQTPHRGRSRPVSPSRTMVAGPPSGVTIAGTPLASASRTTLPKVSVCEGKTNRSILA